MAKVGLFASLALIVAAIGFTTLSGGSAQAGDACVRKTFQTTMVKDACKAGGADAAKDAMKKWNKEKKIKSCNQCHTKLAPTYELKADGLKQYKDLGGK